MRTRIGIIVGITLLLITFPPTRFLISWFFGVGSGILIPLKIILMLVGLASLINPQWVKSKVINPPVLLFKKGKARWISYRNPIDPDYNEEEGKLNIHVEGSPQYEKLQEDMYNEEV